VTTDPESTKVVGARRPRRRERRVRLKTLAPTEIGTTTPLQRRATPTGLASQVRQQVTQHTHRRHETCRLSAIPLLSTPVRELMGLTVADRLDRVTTEPREEMET